MVKNKRTIPEIRERLTEIADEEGINELRELAAEMFRKPPVRRATVKSPHLTPKLAEEIRQYEAAHPDEHFSKIAAHFNVNPGRISEAMNRLI